MEIYRGEFETTASHWWWRPGWGPDSRYLTFHLTFGDEPALSEAAARYAEPLAAQPTIDPVPVEWLHLTMTGIGFVPDVPAGAIEVLAERLLDEATDAVGHPGPLVLDTLFLGREGLSLTAAAPHWLATLKRAQEHAVETLLGPREWGRFYPHASLAYFSGLVSEHPLMARIQEIGLRDVIVSTPTLSLLELRREGHLYRWRSLAERVLDLTGGETGR